MGSNPIPTAKRNIKMKLFLDDVRNPKDCLSYMHQRIGKLNPIYDEEWVVVKNYEEFKSFINENHEKLTHVSFDHDLADGHYDVTMYHNLEAYEKHLESVEEQTGYDCAKYLKWFYSEHKKVLPIMFVHSMNPIGTKRIIDLFK